MARIDYNAAQQFAETCTDRAFETGDKKDHLVAIEAARQAIVAYSEAERYSQEFRTQMKRLQQRIESHEQAIK